MYETVYLKIRRRQLSGGEGQTAGLGSAEAHTASSRGRETYGTLYTIVLDGKPLSAFAFESGAPFQMPVFFVTKQG